VQDIFFSANLPFFADVVLPASPSLEKRRHVLRARKRRIQRLYQVFRTFGRQPPRTGELSRDIANRLGADVGSISILPKFYREIASLTPLFAGVTYERARRVSNPLQWPVAADGNGSAAALYKRVFAFPDGQSPGCSRFPLTETDGPAQRRVPRDQ